ncbi:hypothetical protein HYS03_00140 [Candidatus Woesebacteria bacterium]|nr:hypothetical protein [Candidatus Woesebacteria bacterium]
MSINEFEKHPTSDQRACVIGERILLNELKKGEYLYIEIHYLFGKRANITVTYGDGTSDQRIVLGKDEAN